MKSESHVVAEDTQWKAWRHKDIIAQAVEDDHLRLSRALANCEEKFKQQERVHKAVKAELAAEREQKFTLQRSLEFAYDMIKRKEIDLGKLETLSRRLYLRTEKFKKSLRKRVANDVEGESSGSESGTNQDCEG